MNPNLNGNPIGNIDDDPNNDNTDIFSYFRLGESNIFGNDPEPEFNGRRTRERQIAENKENERKITYKLELSITRLIFLLVIYILQTHPLTLFLIHLISFLLISEALVISNYFLMKLAIGINELRHREEPYFPKFCLIFDLMNDLIFFTWFIYGNICLLTDKKGVEESLRYNSMLTYYLTILVLLGYFIFAKIIFYILFFITFSPCLLYVLIKDLHKEYVLAQKAKKIRESLEPISYEKYIREHGNENDMCVICIEYFKNEDKIVMLPCSIKHIFHQECIYAWIKKKPICPTCKTEIGIEGGLGGINNIQG